MPEISISEDLHEQLESESAGDLEDLLWTMLGSYRRTNSPQADVGEGHSFDEG